MLVSETSFCRETSGGVRKYPLWGGTLSVLLGNCFLYYFLYCFRRLDVVVVEISVIYCHFVV